jgi:hypothetical protein
VEHPEVVVHRELQDQVVHLELMVWGHVINGFMTQLSHPQVLHHMMSGSMIPT